MVRSYNYNQRNVQVLDGLEEIHDHLRRLKEVEEQKQRENEQMKHKGGKYETMLHILTCRCMIHAYYHVLPSYRHCAPPSSPPTGPSTGSPTSPRGAYTVYRPYADGMELFYRRMLDGLREDALEQAEQDGIELSDAQLGNVV